MSDRDPIADALKILEAETKSELKELRDPLKRLGAPLLRRAVRLLHDGKTRPDDVFALTFEERRAAKHMADAEGHAIRVQFDADVAAVKAALLRVSQFGLKLLIAAL